jgi:hypothetical protein
MMNMRGKPHGQYLFRIQIRKTLVTSDGEDLIIMHVAEGYIHRGEGFHGEELKLYFVKMNWCTNNIYFCLCHRFTNS